VTVEWSSHVEMGGVASLSDTGFRVRGKRNEI
jgi:hypothetical protein